jgi:hypothetical protein
MTLVFLIPSIICFCVAAYLAYIGREGWGWFLFVGFLIVPVASSTQTGHKPITIDFTAKDYNAPTSPPSDNNP